MAVKEKIISSINIIDNLKAYSEGLGSEKEDGAKKAMLNLMDILEQSIAEIRAENNI